MSTDHEVRRMVLRDVAQVIGDYDGRSRTVLEYSLVMKQLVDRAKEPGFSREDWAPLAELVAVDEFERVGNFKDLMGWDEYVTFLTAWAPTAAWECSFKRVTESEDLVFLELEERVVTDGVVNAVNSLSVYELDGAGRVRHLDIYLQMPIPDDFLPEAYKGVRIAD